MNKALKILNNNISIKLYYENFKILIKFNNFLQKFQDFNFIFFLFD